MWSQNRCKLLNIIFILFCFVHNSEGTDVYGSYLNALAKIVLNGIGYKMCIKRCAASSPSNCKSYSYNMYDKACSIYNQDTSTSTLVTGTNVWYGERPNIPAVSMTYFIENFNIDISISDLNLKLEIDCVSHENFKQFWFLNLCFMEQKQLLYYIKRKIVNLFFEFYDCNNS